MKTLLNWPPTSMILDDYNVEHKYDIKQFDGSLNYLHTKFEFIKSENETTQPFLIWTFEWPARETT